jgi:hypothetical protein
MNRDKVRINWQFDRKTARRKFRYKKYQFTRSRNQAAQSAIKDLSVTFHKAYRWSAYSLSGLAVVIGLVLGTMFEYWVTSPPKPVAETPPTVVQAPPQAVPNQKKKR